MRLLFTTVILIILTALMFALQEKEVGMFLGGQSSILLSALVWRFKRNGVAFLRPPFNEEN